MGVGVALGAARFRARKATVDRHAIGQGEALKAAVVGVRCAFVGVVGSCRHPYLSTGLCFRERQCVLQQWIGILPISACACSRCACPHVNHGLGVGCQRGT